MSFWLTSETMSHSRSSGMPPGLVMITLVTDASMFANTTQNTTNCTSASCFPAYLSYVSSSRSFQGLGSPSVSSNDPFKLGIRKHLQSQKQTYSKVKGGEEGDQAVSDEDRKIVDDFVALNLEELPPGGVRRSDPRRQTALALVPLTSKSVHRNLLLVQG